MRRLWSIIVPIIGLWHFSAIGQELPPIENFSPSQYNAANQNWSIAQSTDKIIYVANNNGLLEFNGASWRLYPSPNGTIMRSVTVHDDIIYTGCYMEFGFWQRNKFGLLVYRSISDSLDVDVLNDEEFWKIEIIDRWIVFQSLNRIYIYDQVTKSINTVSIDGIINKMFVLDGIIYFQKLNAGLYKIENGKAQLLTDDDLIRNSEVINVFGEEVNLQLLTKNKGFLSLTDKRVVQLGGANSSLINLGIYAAIKLENGNFAIGTIANGLIYFNQETGTIYHINQSRGLQNNTVLSLYEDLDGNIWTGLDNGISYLNNQAPISFYEDKTGVLGSVYASAVTGNTIYLGTNQGLFYKPLKSSENFRFMEGTEGQVWSLEIIDGELFCGHHRGTFIVNGQSVLKVNDTEGTWSIKKLENQPNALIQGSYDGLYILNRSNGRWRLRNKLEGFDISARSFEVFEERIMVNHEYRGVFHLLTAPEYTEIINVRLDTLLKGSNSSIAKYNGDILYAYLGGIMKYDPIEDTFLKDSILSTIYTEDNYISGKIIPGSQGDRFWTFTKDEILMVTSGNLTEAPEIESVPLNLNVRRDVVEYENISKLNGGNKYLLGTSFGYITFDQEQFEIDDFEVRIGTIRNGMNQNQGGSGYLVEQSVKEDFPSSENNLQIDFYTPSFYKFVGAQYQFQLLGQYDNWSNWSNQSNVFYENLPSGDYTFNVRAKLGDKISRNVASFSFTVEKPWYITNIMVAFYSVTAIVLLIFTHYTYRAYYNKQQKALIEQSRREMELAKLQNEKEIIKIKNDQLRQEFKAKSTELAASIMSMERKNELLLEIKQQLGTVEKKESLNEIIGIIDKNLHHDDEWDIFKDAFDSIDNEFFKNLTERHPELSPNDLKLCAYLRLNLTSKDIAQVFNISPKSVEIKRYRLRKKLNLDGSQNLINYILNV